MTNPRNVATPIPTVELEPRMKTFGRLLSMLHCCQAIAPRPGYVVNEKSLLVVGIDMRAQDRVEAMQELRQSLVGAGGDPRARVVMTRI